MQTNSETKLFQPKNEKKLRIYAWSTLEIKKFEGCLKVGQTTRDVNKRIKESQGVAQVEYTLEINEEAYTEKGTLFTETPQGLECLIITVPDPFFNVFKISNAENISL